MTPERWGRIEAACQAALAAPLPGRAATLDRACGGDAQLRSEVEALLAEQDRAEHLLDTSAWDAAATEFADDEDGDRAPRLRRGDRLGPYVIEDLLALGGMGEVYLASDTRLDRIVAVKVLPPETAADAASRERFELEARAVSRLSHPHICALFDIGSASLPAVVAGEPERGIPSSVDYLVMEYVEGQTLLQRMSPSPTEGRDARRALSMSEALEYGRQVADALAAAHRRGIIHCDLKPGNVMLTREGVKLLDFGIARMNRAALAATPGDAGAAARRADVGAVLGTVNYMAPEQFAGKEPDARSDLFALGALLFEMVTGRRAFEGASPAGVVTSILGDTPPRVSALRPLAPPALDDLVQRLLVKEPDARWDSARLAADELRRMSAELAADRSSPAHEPVASVNELAPGAAASRERAPRSMRLAWFGVASVAAIGLLLGGFAVRHALRPAPRLFQRFDLDLGPGFEAHPRVAHAVLSPDGSRIVFTERTGNGNSRLVSRRLDGGHAVTLVEGLVARPFFSPDSRWIAYFEDDGRLSKVSVDGGAPVPLSDIRFGADRGASWGDDGTIVVAPNLTGGLARIPAGGGAPVPLTTVDASTGEVTQRWPQVLPGSRAVLFTAHTIPGFFDDASIVVQRLDTGERKTLHRGGFFGRYLPSGHLVFARGNTLYAAPMNLARLELTGAPMAVATDVVTDPDLGRFEFSASTTGAALCFTGAWQPAQHSPVWVDRAGRVERLPVPPAAYADPRVSMRGSVVMSTGTYSARRLALHEPGLEEPRQLPWPRTAITPTWAPDDVHVVFVGQDEQGVLGLYWRRADGSGPVLRLIANSHLQWAGSFSLDGRTLAYTDLDPVTDADIWMVSLDLSDPDRPVPGTPRLWLRTPVAETNPVFSPDGRWIAFTSNESGRMEVYVRRAEGDDARWQVSRNGGVNPVWVRRGTPALKGRRSNANIPMEPPALRPGNGDPQMEPRAFRPGDSDEIVFQQGPERQLMIVPYRTSGGEFVAGTPVPWPGAKVAPFEPSYTIRNFDLSPDGARVLLLGPPDPAPPPSRANTTLFLNLFDELRRKMGR